MTNSPQKNPNSEVLFFINLELQDGKNEKISFGLGDYPEEVAYSFCKQHTLNGKVYNFIVAAIQDKLAEIHDDEDLDRSYQNSKRNRRANTPEKRGHTPDSQRGKLDTIDDYIERYSRSRSLLTIGSNSNASSRSRTPRKGGEDSNISLNGRGGLTDNEGQNDQRGFLYEMSGNPALNTSDSEFTKLREDYVRSEVRNILNSSEQRSLPVKYHNKTAEEYLAEIHDGYSDRKEREQSAEKSRPVGLGQSPFFNEDRKPLSFESSANFGRGFQSDLKKPHSGDESTLDTQTNTTNKKNPNMKLTSVNNLERRTPTVKPLNEDSDPQFISFATKTRQLPSEEVDPIGAAQRLYEKGLNQYQNLQIQREYVQKAKEEAELNPQWFKPRINRISCLIAEKNQSNERTHDRLNKYGEARDLKKEQIRRIKEEVETSQYDFKPRIDRISEKINEEKLKLFEEQQYAHRHEHLYIDALVKKDNASIERLHLNPNCTFMPKVSRKSQEIMSKGKPELLDRFESDLQERVSKEQLAQQLKNPKVFRKLMTPDISKSRLKKSVEKKIVKRVSEV